MYELPEGVELPAGRNKPWGTGHAILACKEVLHEPFAVINADDYYPDQAYKDFIAAQQSEDKRIKLDLVPADEERRASRIVIFE